MSGDILEHNKPIQTLMQHLWLQYTGRTLGDAGQEAPSSAFEKFLARLNSPEYASLVSNQADVLCDVLEDFCDFSNAYLSKNPPTATYALGQGTGLRLGNGTVVALTGDNIVDGSTEAAGDIHI